MAAHVCKAPAQVLSALPHAALGVVAFVVVFYQAGLILVPMQTPISPHNPPLSPGLAPPDATASPISVDSVLGGLLARLGMVGVTTIAALSGEAHTPPAPTSLNALALLPNASAFPAL